MYNKNLYILNQYCFNKFFLVEKFYPSGSLQSFLNCVGSQSKFFFSKLNIGITAGEEKYLKDHLQDNICQ